MKDEFEYCIIFDDSNIEENVAKNITGVHFYNNIFDKHVEACWYIMHLPRTIYDLRNINNHYWNGNINKAHNIIFLPSSMAEDYEYQDTALVICLGDCEKQAKGFCCINKTILGYIHLSSLNDNQLQTHWKQLCTKFSSSKKISDNLKLVNADERNSLPLLFLEHYLQSMDDFFERINEEFKLFDECFYETSNLRANINACFDKDHNGCNTQGLLKKYLQTTGIPITISMMGRKTNKKMYPNYDKTKGEINAVKLTGVHNAIARDGLYVELDMLSEKVFELVNNLECACKGKTPNHKFIWRTLENIGKELNKIITDEQLKAIAAASSIVAFTDFPIGLAKLPNTNQPLCISKNIIYRHLSPLPHCIMSEISCNYKHSLKDKCKILMMECLEETDEIRYYSDTLLRDVLFQLESQYASIEVYYEEVYSIADFNKIIANNDVDILLISAHGKYEKNCSGLYIGKEVLCSIEQITKKLPAVVLLSACHVSPRGRGIMTILDTLIFSGAHVVLGTYIPVDVRKNALLMQRLILNIIFTQNGETDFSNLSEIWHFVASSNACSEIVNSNPSILRWIEREKRKGVSVEHQFKLRSRLSSLNIYNDTLNVLIELASDIKIKNNLMRIKNERDYFPESFFYCMYGHPENILF